MSRHPTDSFLPSGAVDPSRKAFSHRDSISPMSIPRSVPDYFSAHNSSHGSPNAFMASQSPSQHPPISPPKTRSGSAEEGTAALVEDWRAYTQKLRSQSAGERAHIMADRARLEEVQAEERALWDKERDILKARIAELEAQLGKKGGDAFVPLHINRRPHAMASPGSVAASVTGSIDGTASRSVPQESGRDADGSVCWAPAPRNVSRTFDPNETSTLRVDSISTPQESAIRVTSKELTSSDFGVQPDRASHDLETITESPAESIDISQIRPDLEGVSIRASAVDPTFIANVMSPYRSPSKLSPNVHPPARDITNLALDSSSKDDHQRQNLGINIPAENRRLTMHAGHTPNHSVFKFPFVGGDAGSGVATPTQGKHPEAGSVHRESIVQLDGGDQADEREDSDHGDRELSGPLSLPCEMTKENLFLTTLCEKLEDVRRNSAEASPISESGRTTSIPSRKKASDTDDETIEGPELRMKPSINFGKPLGRI